mgnify:CR=1 FL=1
MNNKIKEVSEIDIKQVINLSTICSAISLNIRKYNKRNKSLHQYILNINYKHKNITILLNVESFRKKRNIESLDIYF